jgi:hypothetical protein
MGKDKVKIFLDEFCQKKGVCQRDPGRPY